MTRFALLSLLLAAVLVTLDVYVYRNWRRFARPRARLRWTLAPYLVAMAIMPWLLPAYFALSRWWEVEPKLFRAAVIGLCAFYYLPKLLVAAVLVLKDLARFATWLFAWFQARLRPAGEPTSDHAGAAPGTSPSASPDAPTGAGLDLADMGRISRSDFLRQLGWTAASIPFVVVGYGLFRTLYDFDVRHVAVPVAGLPRALEGLTIAQLSDLHAGSLFSRRPMQDAVALVNELRPSLAVITGDYVNHDAAELEVIQGALGELRAELGVFGCLGNHDHYARVGDVVERVRATPVDLLVNEHRTLRVDGARLHVIGTDNTGFRQHYADLPGALDGLDADPNGEELRLLLAHDPTFWDGHVRPGHPEIDLMLCGHTHGGQIGLELGPLRWSLAGAVYDRWAGLYVEERSPAGRADASQHGPQYLYVNRGVGTVGPPIRLGIRPEVTLLTLHRADAA